MANWIISNIENKSVYEIKIWIKNGQTIQMKEAYRFGEWAFEAEVPPAIDLDNEQGFEITSSEYEWEMLSMTDGMGYEWFFPEEMDEIEKEKIQDVWREEFHEGLEALGWQEQDVSQWIFGPIALSEEPSDD